MESSLSQVQPIALVRPPGAHRFEAFSPKLQRRITFYQRFPLELWILLETDPAVVTFCERPGYMQIEGGSRLADFLIRYVDHDELVFLTAGVDVLGFWEWTKSGGVSFQRRTASGDLKWLCRGKAEKADNSNMIRTTYTASE